MDREYAEKLLSEAKTMNDGAWIDHSYHVARLAENCVMRYHWQMAIAMPKRRWSTTCLNLVLKIQR